MKKKYIKYHNNGSVWAKGTTSNGIAEGYWEWFRKGGTKMRSGYFKNSKQVGKWTTYNANGGIVKVTDFDAKKLKKQKEFTAKGKL